MTHNELVEYMKASTTTIDDQTALSAIELYPEWQDSPTSYVVGDRVRFTFSDGKTKLCKCKQDHEALSNRTPELYPAGWDVIDVVHAGTITDPVPYDQNMEVFFGKYYSYGENLYKCIRDSGQPLYAAPDTLLNDYFELV